MCTLTWKMDWEGPHPSERAASKTRLQPSVTWDMSIFQEILDSQVFIENIPLFKSWEIKLIN